MLEALKVLWAITGTALIGGLVYYLCSVWPLNLHPLVGIFFGAVAAIVLVSISIHSLEESGEDCE